MEFTADMFWDLGYKCLFLLGYAVAVIVAWMLAERVVGAFRRKA